MSVDGTSPWSPSGLTCVILTEGPAASSTRAAFQVTLSKPTGPPVESTVPRDVSASLWLADVADDEAVESVTMQTIFAVIRRQLVFFAI